MASLEEVRASLQSAQKDVESKTATIRHLQNALNAKSMTIEILSKHNKEGGDLDAVITASVQGKMEAERAKIKELEDEKKVLAEALAAANERARSVGPSPGQAQALQDLRRDLEAALEAGRLAEKDREAAVAAVRRAEAEVSAVRRELEEARRQPAEVLLPPGALPAEEAEALSRRAEEEQRRAADALAELRVYQRKAFDLKSENDVLSSQLEQTQQDMQAMQVDHEEALRGLQEELSTLKGDREAQWRAVAEQIDQKVREVRLQAEREAAALMGEQAESREHEQRRLRELTEELDTVRLRCGAQQVELAALREALGDNDAETSPPECTHEPAEAKGLAPELDSTMPAFSSVLGEAAGGAGALAPGAAAEEAQAGEAPPPSARAVSPGKRERFRALREQSQFAFDEMAKRMTEVREEAEAERKRLQADWEQKLKERAARIVELTNTNDTLQTQVETLERSSADLARQRDDLAKSLRERERSATVVEADLEGMSEGNRFLQQKLATYKLVFALQRGVVAPALSLFRQRLGWPGARAASVAPGLDEEGRSSVDAEADKCESLMDASTADGEGGADLEDVEEEEEEDEEENAYGLDQDGQEAWAEMLRANTLNALFTGVDVVVENARTAAKDIQDQVEDILTSLDMFPMLYAQQLEALDRVRKGKDLRKFVTILQKAMSRCQRIASAITELSSRSDDVTGNLQNLVRVRGLEWNLRSLRTAGQYEILFKLQRNHLQKVKADYDDVLDQYGEQCERTSQLEGEVEELKKELEELRAQAAALKAAAAAGGAAERLPPEATATAAAPATPSMQGIHQMLSDIERDARQGPSEPPPEKGKAKGKAKGLPPPGASSAQRPEDSPPEVTGAETSAAAEAPAAPAKGKGKSKGPPPPGAKAAAAALAAVAAEAEAEAEEPPAAAPSGKGKKGPPPPPGGKGKGPPAPTEGAAPPVGKGKGPPPPGGKGKGPAAPPGGGGAAGKGPPGAAAKGGAKGGKPGDLSEEAKEALKGPEPPRDLVPKKFHWTAVTGARFATSVFAQIVDDMTAAQGGGGDGAKARPRSLRMRLNLDALTNAFFARKKEDEGKDESKGAKRKAIAQCLDGKKSQNVEIFLNGCGVNIDQVRSCVVELDEQAMGMDVLGKVIELYPEGEELQLLKTFEQENDPAVLPWGRAEQFLVSLMQMQHFKVRAECCKTRGLFKEEFAGVEQDVATLKKCLGGLVKSTALPAIFALVMQVGNYLNYGSNKGAQRGFTLDTLPLLARVEGFTDKTYTLMRFVMETLESERKIREEAFEDMKLCDPASKIDFEDAARRLGELEKAVDKVAASVRPADGSEAGASELKDSKFEAAMRDFARGARADLERLRKEVEEVQELTKACIDLYAEKPKTPAGETLAKFAAFRKDMEEARRQNLLAKAKKEKAEKRRAEAAAKVKKEAPDAAAAAAAAPSASASSSAPDAVPGDGAANATPSASSTAPAAMRTMRVKIPDRTALPHVPHRRMAGVLHDLGLPLPGSAGAAPGAADGERRTMGAPAGLERRTLGAPGGLLGGERRTLGVPGGVGGAAAVLGGPRLSLGPTVRGVDVLHVSKTGRLSIQASSRKAFGREEIARLLESSTGTGRGHEAPT